MLLIGHPPHGSEPILQRNSCSMKYRSRRNRGLVSTLATHQEASCCCPTAVSRALRTTKPGRPPQPSEISTTRTFCREALLKLGESPHKVLHGVTPLFLGELESSAYMFARKVVQDSVECQGHRGHLTHLVLALPISI